MPDDAQPQKRIVSDDERRAISNRIIAIMPEALKHDREAFEAWYGPRWANALAEAEYTSAPLEGSATERALGGAWEFLNPVTVVEGLANAVVHPVDTTVNILKSHGREAVKTYESAK